MATAPRGHGIIIASCRLLYVLTLTSIGPLSLIWLVGYLIEDGHIRRAYGMGHGVVVTAIAAALMVLLAVEGAVYLRQDRARRDANARLLRRTSQGRVWCNALMTPVVLASGLPALYELQAMSSGTVVIITGPLLLLTIAGTAAVSILALTTITVDRARVASTREAEAEVGASGPLGEQDSREA